jgi:predicted nucleotide-binding protein (sugar kinase/HSP70/actin superfamily)
MFDLDMIEKGFNKKIEEITTDDLLNAYQLKMRNLKELNKQLLSENQRLVKTKEIMEKKLENSAYKWDIYKNHFKEEHNHVYIGISRNYKKGSLLTNVP